MQDFWKRFRRDRLAMIGLATILLSLALGFEVARGREGIRLIFAGSQPF